MESSLALLNKVKDDNEKLTKRIQEIELKLFALTKEDNLGKSDNKVIKWKRKVIKDKRLKENSDINKIEVEVNCHSENIISHRGNFSRKKIQQKKFEDDRLIINTEEEP
ncbi:hypothetical protein O3M35_008679 [Rhynocoris fuscipes]|uniref:Uncharacterized protein n=1 Tax=Rhynocoris fuscipes TaxID=488301 RepID=A0AAW1D9R2_9HEMI